LANCAKKSDLTGLITSADLENLKTQIGEDYVATGGVFTGTLEAVTGDFKGTLTCRGLYVDLFDMDDGFKIGNASQQIIGASDAIKSSEMYIDDGKLCFKMNSKRYISESK
jgi:hypothetical protein